MSVCWEVEASTPPCLFSFIPLLCQFESYDPDPEVAQLSGFALSGLARTMINPKHMDTLLGILKSVWISYWVYGSNKLWLHATTILIWLFPLVVFQAAELPSWRARLCVLEFLKVFALNNTSIFASSDHWSGEVVQLVLRLLADRKLEVRENASKILCGFLHCLLVRNPMDLLVSRINSFTI